MQSVLIVNTAASSYDLTTLAKVKAELGLPTPSSEDANLATWITQASAACATYCKRVFGLEVVTETFRNHWNIFRDGNRVDEIKLSRFPIVTIVSIVEDSIPLVVDIDYWQDSEGILYRLDTNDSVKRWCFKKLVVNYSGGYALPALPSYVANLERACINQVQALRSGAGRDPAIRSENINGVLQTTYASPSSSDNGALDPSVTALLDPFRNITV
jgi:hypothetical protein